MQRYPKRKTDEADQRLLLAGKLVLAASVPIQLGLVFVIDELLPDSVWVLVPATSLVSTAWSRSSPMAGASCGVR